MLPNVLLALIVFVLFIIAAKAIRNLVRRLTHERRHARNLEAMQETEGVLSQPSPDVIVVDLAASTVNIRARWWVKPPRRAPALDLQDRVLTAIKNKLTANGIDMPFPTQQILFHDQTEETDGDRLRQREGWPAGQGEIPKPRSIEDALRQLVEAQAQPNSKGRAQSASDL